MNDIYTDGIDTIHGYADDFPKPIYYHWKFTLLAGIVGYSASKNTIKLISDLVTFCEKSLIGCDDQDMVNLYYKNILKLNWTNPIGKKQKYEQKYVSRIGQGKIPNSSIDKMTILKIKDTFDKIVNQLSMDSSYSRSKIINDNRAKVYQAVKAIYFDSFRDSVDDGSPFFVKTFDGNFVRRKNINPKICEKDNKPWILSPQAHQSNVDAKFQMLKQYQACFKFNF